MLQRSSPECESRCMNGDQPTVEDSTAIDVAGTSSDAGLTDESDEDEDDSRCGPDSWDDEDDDSRCCHSDCYHDEEDEGCSSEVLDESEVWDSDGKYEGCHRTTTSTNLWEDDDDEDLEKNSEDEDCDNGPSKRDVSNAPLMKRVKTSHAVAASPNPSKNIRWKHSLSLLPTMPLDVLFEIFSHLSPADIIKLSRSSKIFHETLSSRNMPSLWKAVRKRFSAPDGPDWMSEEVWVELLFGHNCQSCGKSYNEVDFLLLKRVCISCKTRHYVAAPKVEKRYPDFDFVVLLVPSTNSSPWNTWITSKYYYWKLDVDSMVNKLTALKKDADAQLLHCFMEERKRRLQCIRENLSTWREGHKQILRDRAQEEKEAEQIRLQQVKERFKESGYIDADLEYLYSRKACRGPGKIHLTDKIWARIHPILKPVVEQTKAQRLERELVAIKSKRRQVLAARYKEFQRTLHPSQWKYLPRTLEVAAFESFSQHIEADIGVEVNGTTFDDAFLEFPALHAAATEQRKTKLRALIRDTSREFEDGEIGADPIDLATAVFNCVESHNVSRPFNCVFGWDEIASHHCLPDMEGTDIFFYRGFRAGPSELRYVPEIAAIVSKLAQRIGLNAATSTAADFDEKDKRFACEACPRVRKDNSRYLEPGYTWRNLAVHLATSKTHNPNFFITVLSGEAENEVKQCERNDKKWDANQWTCSHCPEYLDNLQARQSIVEHLSDSHGIQVPSEPTDLFFFERYRRDWATNPSFSDPARKGGMFRCLECVTVSTSKRLFSLHGVVDHLRAKHKVTSAQNGIHLALA